VLVLVAAVRAVATRGSGLGCAVRSAGP